LETLDSHGIAAGTCS
jgi:asparagine synthase (glutamine-hydrolysing)